MAGESHSLWLAPLALLALSSCVDAVPVRAVRRSRNLYEHGPSVSNNTVTCGPDTCGAGAHCTHDSVRPVCSCLPDHTGDPLAQCIRVECLANNECPAHLMCVYQHCVNPCVGACGFNANCDVRNHVPVCSCPTGYKGNPFNSCRVADSGDLCEPNPCGTNAKCTPGHDRPGPERPVCTCPSGYIGNPLVNCDKGEVDDDDDDESPDSAPPSVSSDATPLSVSSVSTPSSVASVSTPSSVSSDSTPSSVSTGSSTTPGAALKGIIG